MHACMHPCTQPQSVSFVDSDLLLRHLLLALLRSKEEKSRKISLKEEAGRQEREKIGKKPRNSKEGGRVSSSSFLCSASKMRAKRKKRKKERTRISFLRSRSLVMKQEESRPPAFQSNCTTRSSKQTAAAAADVDTRQIKIHSSTYLHTDIIAFIFMRARAYRDLFLFIHSH